MNLQIELPINFWLFCAFILIMAIFFLWMLIDCLKRQFPDKAMWVLLIIFLTFVGALIYFFTERRKLIRESKSPSKGQSPETISSTSTQQQEYNLSDSLPPSVSSNQTYTSTVPQSQNRSLASQIYPSPSTGLLDQEKLTEKSKSSINNEKPKKSNRLLILLIIIIILLCFGGGGYLAFTLYKNATNLITTPSVMNIDSSSPANNTKSEANNEPNRIIIKSSDQTKDLVSFTLPQNWISEPYYPNGIGYPISLFASKEDKAKADEASKTDPAGSNNTLSNASGYGFRYVNGVVREDIHDEPSNAMKAYRAQFQNNNLIDQVVVDGKVFNEGMYYCVSYKNPKNYYVPCWVVFNNKITVIFGLNTTFDNYAEDLANYFKVIESTKILL